MMPICMYNGLVYPDVTFLPLFLHNFGKLLRVARDIASKGTASISLVWQRFTELLFFLKFHDDSRHLPFIPAATIYFLQSWGMYMLIGATCRFFCGWAYPAAWDISVIIHLHSWHRVLLLCPHRLYVHHPGLQPGCVHPRGMRECMICVCCISNAPWLLLTLT